MRFRLCVSHDIRFELINNRSYLKILTALTELKHLLAFGGLPFVLFRKMGV